MINLSILVSSQNANFYSNPDEKEEQCKIMTNMAEATRSLSSAYLRLATNKPHPRNSLFTRTTCVMYQKSKTSLDLNKARDDRVLGCSGII